MDFVFLQNKGKQVVYMRTLVAYKDTFVEASYWKRRLLVWAGELAPLGTIKKTAGLRPAAIKPKSKVHLSAIWLITDTKYGSEWHSLWRYVVFPNTFVFQIMCVIRLTMVVWPAWYSPGVTPNFFPEALREIRLLVIAHGVAYLCECIGLLLEWGRRLFASGMSLINSFGESPEMALSFTESCVGSG